jgi:hypothetical protein
MITGKPYDGLKWISQIILPALGSIYYALAQIWDLGEALHVVGTIMIMDLVVGVILSLSQRAYAKQIGQGDLLVSDDEDGPGMRLELDQTPEELATKQEVRFKVKRRTSV